MALSAIGGVASFAGVAVGSPMSSMWGAVGSLQIVNVASVLDIYMPSTVKEFSDSLSFANMKNPSLNEYWNS